MEGLERYRNLGYQCLQKFPPEEIEENKQALDEAFSDSVRRLEEFHGHGKAGSGSSIRSDISDSS
ncbi:MAG: hypothetical protein LUO81_04440 [Methanoregulaceae archaeon]|nr:hypothetical protein [Methanoregulaceae archaeon]